MENTINIGGNDEDWAAFAHSRAKLAIAQASRAEAYLLGYASLYRTVLNRKAWNQNGPENKLSNLPERCVEAYQVGQGLDVSSIKNPFGRVSKYFEEISEIGVFQVDATNLPAAFIAGMLSRISPEDFLNLYDEKVGETSLRREEILINASFPPAARDLAYRIFSTSQENRLAEPGTLFSPQEPPTRIDGAVPIEASGKEETLLSSTKHVVHLTLPSPVTQKGFPLPSDSLTQFFVARDKAGVGTLDMTTFVPLGATPEDVASFISRESIGAALYLGTETTNRAGSLPVHTHIIDTSTPAGGDTNWLHPRIGTGAPDSLQWFLSAFRRGVPADVIVMCGKAGVGEPDKWELPPGVHIVDKRGTALHELPIDEIAAAARTARAALLGRPPRGRLVRASQMPPERRSDKSPRRPHV
ncbi:MAG: hypothetical protein DLM55_12545 [Acidimicrobiales bacterium]|nr:MAG: hypothetical protein DLM55_12545 [Acidimicrobiales bacterium]